MIIVDTSVWVDYFNGTESHHSDLLDNALIEGLVLMGDIIFLEILQGFRNSNNFKQAKSALSTLEQLPMLGVDMVTVCANNYRSLRKQGITIRRKTDVIIATFCIKNNLPLLFQDRDFVPFVEKLKLKPVVEKI